ncbi:MAG: redoxin domain-containing protein [Bacteroidales bacterium]|nr:redoxin domain-containing protein [Bacteroidales bacterium]
MLYIFFLYSFLFRLVSSKSQDLRKGGIDDSYRVPEGLRVGDTAPDFMANDQENKPFHLYKALEKDNVVLVFYRGNWCPFLQCLPE